MSNNIKPAAIFDRRRSGYVRDFNVLDVFMFNVMGFALGLALSTNAPFIGSFAPTANVLVVIILGATLAFFNGLTYGWFGGIMPSTGGDYVFVSRGLNHRLGFLTSWGFTVCQLYGLAMNIGWILSVGIAPALLTLGVSTGNQKLVSLGVSLSKPSMIAIGSIILLVFYFTLAYLEIGLRRIVLYPLFLLGLTGTGIMASVLYSSDASQFVSTFDAFMTSFNGTSNAHALALTTAQHANLSALQGVDWRASLQAVPLGFLCFLGFTYSVYVGGEIREPQKSQVRGIMAALLLGVVVFGACMSRYVALVGQEFHSAIGFPNVLEKLGLPVNSMNLITGVLVKSKSVNVVMQLGNIVWFLLVPYVMLQVCAHNFVAWTCDHLLPKKVLARSGPANAPWVALLAATTVAAIAVLLNYVFGFTIVGAAAMAAVAFFLTGIAAFRLPSRRPDIFARAPRLMRLPILGLTLFQLVGLVGAIGFGWIIYAAIRYPEVAGGTSTRTIIALVIVYAIGLLIYEIAISIAHRRSGEAGVNVDSLLAEIPDD